MSGFTGADVLVVFVREPKPGAVKSRLAARIGPDGAAAVYRVLAEELVRRTTPHRDEYDRVLAFDPPSGGAAVGDWLGVETSLLLPQSSGDIGMRMERAFAELFARGARRIALVGTDVPALGREDVRDALESLDDHDMAIGPATDGGYYLIALKGPQPELFEGIGWSGPTVLADTLDRASRLDLSVSVLRTIGDVDTVEDLAAEWPRIRALFDAETRGAIERRLRPI